MQVSGGIRFLPIYGESGSGKTSATLELGTHLPDVRVVQLSRASIESQDVLRKEINSNEDHPIVAVIDQYEEAAAQRENIPTTFIETLALLDRGELRTRKILFIWLTTSRAFAKQLSDATSRNKRILLQEHFEIHGPNREEWPPIIGETFRFHNQEKDLADYEILDIDLTDASKDANTLGSAIERVGERLYKATHTLQDLSSYQVVIL